MSSHRMTAIRLFYFVKHGNTHCEAVSHIDTVPPKPVAVIVVQVSITDHAFKMIV